MWTIDIQHKKHGLLMKCDWKVSHTITCYFMNTGKVYFFRKYKLHQGDTNKCAVFENFCSNDFLPGRTSHVWDINQEIVNINKSTVNRIHFKVMCDHKVAYKIDLGLHGGKYDIIYESKLPELGTRKLNWVQETGDAPRKLVPKGFRDYVLEPHGPLLTYQKLMWRKRRMMEEQ